MAVQIAYSLEDLQGDPQASMAALCQLWADELPAEYAVKVFAVRDEFLKVHGRARLGHLFKLDISQARCIFEKHLDLGWLDSFELYAGFRFERPTVPESAVLVNKTNLTNPRIDAARSHKKEVMMDGETISKELIAAKINPDTVVLADQCFKVSMTTNPLLQTLQEDEIDEVSFEVVQWVASTWGKINMGAALTRSVARQLTGRFPHLPTRGGLLGKDRKWRTIIFDKRTGTPFTCAHAIALVPRSRMRRAALSAAPPAPRCPRTRRAALAPPPSPPPVRAALLLPRLPRLPRRT
jgi:hypothetical protein